MRTTSTLAALQAANESGLIESEDAQILRDAWVTASSVRDGIMLVQGRASDVLPVDVRERAALAHVLGYPPGDPERLVEDYRRTTRRARLVMERLFYGP